MERLLEDIKFGCRTLVGSPTFSLIAILTLALGIGITTAMFTLINNVLLKPLPFPNSEELVFVSTFNKKKNEQNTGSTIEFFERMVDADSPLQEMAYYAFDQATLSQGDLQKPFTKLITRHNYLSMFGVEPILGRWYDEADINRQLVVISHRVWQTEFAADPNILDKTIQLNKRDFQILGVMPANYSSTGYVSVDFWRPIDQLDRPVNMAARLEGGLSVKQALNRSASLQRLVNEVSGDFENTWEIQYESMLDSIVGDSKAALYLLLASVAAVFLIAVLNVINLTFAQYANRSQELGVRVAVGATRSRLLRQLLTESLMLCGLGGMLGLLLSAWTLEWIQVLMASRLPRLHETGLDAGAVVTTFVLITVAAVVTTLIPAYSIVNPSKLSESIKQAGRKVTGDRSSQRVRRILVAGEVCVAVVLLVCAGLLMRSYQQLSSQEPGFKTENIVTGHIWLPDNFKPQPNFASYWLSLRDALKADSNVLSVAATSTMPMGRTGIDYPVNYSYPGAPTVPRGEEPSASVRSITPDYFTLLEIPILSGRDFDFRDTADSPKVVIINRQLAESAWPNEEAVGQILSLPVWMGDDHTVVAVVGNVKHRGLRATPKPEFFLPVTQHTYPGMSYLVKTASDASNIESHMLQMSINQESTAPMILIQSLADLTADSIVEERLLLTILGAFSTIALVLASVGVYGISDNMVRQRTNEIGIRMAIGARPRTIKRWIIQDNARIVLLGAVFGLCIAFASSRLLASKLYGVSAFDPTIFLIVPIVLILVGIIASWVPATRATRVHPQQALKYE